MSIRIKGQFHQENVVHKRVFVLLLSTVIICGSLLQMDIAAQDQVTMQVRAGFDSYFKANSWMSVRVVVANEGADIEGEVQILPESGGRDVTYTQPAVLPTRSRKQFILYVYAYYNSREITVRLVEGKKTLVEQKVRLQQIGDQNFLYGVVSDDTSALSYLAGLPPRGQRRVHVAHLDLVDLPVQGRALSSVDMLVLHSLDTSGLSDGQRNALRGWVAIGGHLVICGGPNAVPTAAGLGNLLPVEIQGSETTTDVSELGEYASAPFPANVPAVVARVVPVAEDTQVLAGAPGRPFLVRRALDHGYIDYLALDPELEPMRTWIGNVNLWPRLTFSTPLWERLSLASNWGDLSGALANIPSLAIPSVLLVIGFLVFYVIIVGPLNFLILKLVDKRALAWITVPTLILIFSCVAYVVGFTSRGRKAVVSEISVIRARPKSQTAIINSFVGIYSPARRAYDVRLPDNVLVSKLVPSYYGPGSMQSGEMTVEQGPPTYLRGIEVDVGAMSDFSMHTVEPWAGVEANLTLSLANSRYHIAGTITNHSDSAIENCFLLFQSQPVQIANIDAGATASIAANFAPGAYPPVYQLVDQLTSNMFFGGQGRREQERRRDVLYGVFQAGTTRHWSSGQTYEGPVLIGWMPKSPSSVEVVGVANDVYATTLLIAPLPTSQSDPETVIVPLRTLHWQHPGSGNTLSPYELYHNAGSEIFLFQLPPNTRELVIEKMFLHADGLNGAGYGALPKVSLKDTTTDNWEPLILRWGANELQNPGRFINDEGEIEVEVTTDTMGTPLSIDFSAIAKRR